MYKCSVCNVYCVYTYSNLETRSWSKFFFVIAHIYPEPFILQYPSHIRTYFPITHIYTISFSILVRINASLYPFPSYIPALFLTMQFLNILILMYQSPFSIYAKIRIIICLVHTYFVYLKSSKNTFETRICSISDHLKKNLTF